MWVDVSMFCADYCLPSVDIDECALGTHQCPDLTQVCSNTIGGATCICKSQYTTDKDDKCIPVGKRLRNDININVYNPS